MLMPANAAMPRSYDYFQVGLSILIAIAGSYTALDLAGRVTAARGRARTSWLTGGAIAMGTGIWAMHYVAMLAFRLTVPVDYDWRVVLLSLLTGILCSAFALLLVSRRKMGLGYAIAGSVLMGGGIAGLHYIGMAAMRLPAVCRFDLVVVTLSVLFAIVFSFIALWLAFYFRKEPLGMVWRKIGSAMVMGAAISAMHYTGMAAATFYPSGVPPNLSHAVSISALGTLGIALVTLALLGAAVLTCWADRRFSAQALKLQLSEQRFRQLFERSLAGVYCTTLDGRLIDCNDACSRLLGYASRKEHLADAGPGSYLRSVDQEAFIAALKEQKKVTNFERRLRRKGDSTISVVENATLSQDENGNRIDGTLIDITERKRAQEQAIAETRQWAVQTVEEWQQRMELAQKAGLRIGLWDWDLNTNTVVWSDETYRQWGFTHETFSGRTEDALPRVHPDDRPKLDAAIQAVLSGGQEYACQYRVVRPDGTICWLDAHGVMVVHGEFRHMMGIGIDITESKRSQQALQQAQMELARLSRIATMGELTASIAHEVNQPLAAIVTNGSASLRWLALQPPNLEEAREAVSQAIRDANRASDVIARIRALFAKTSPQMAPLDINELIREVLTLNSTDLVRAGVTVPTELQPDLPVVLGDRVQLQQVLLNLIVNGVEAMSGTAPGTRELRIRTLRDGDAVLVSVQDSGKGVDAGQSERIFEPFFTTKSQGIGMGLSLSRSIIEAHGGHLWVAPGKPRGTIFQFTLPSVHKDA